MGGSGSVRSVCSNAYGLSSGLATTHCHEHQSLLHMPELWCDRCSSRRPDSGRDVLPMSQVSPRLARQRRTAYTETKISRTTENGSLTARRLPAILVGACRTRCPSVAGTGSTRARVGRHHGALRHAKDDRYKPQRSCWRQVQRSHPGSADRCASCRPSGGHVGDSAISARPIGSNVPSFNRDWRPCSSR